jgi:protein TonB
MGKIVKYCAACDESFAVKFGFCPNCGQGLTAFELNSPANETPVSEPVKTEVVFEDSIAQTPPPVFTVAAPPVVETAAVSDVQPEAFSEAAKAETIAEAQPVDAPIETKTFAAAAGASGNYQTVADDYQKTSAPEITAREDDGYHITVVEEKNGKQRNLLLLGSLALVLTMAFGSTVYSLFSKDLLIGAIGEDSGVYIPIVDEVPMEVEEEEPKKDDDEGGGGGGGGRDKPTPTSQGQLATQTKDPIMAPSVTNVKKDFELKMQASTQGDRVIKQTNEPYGDPNSKYTLSSDGMGTGGGQGSGIGTGQGSGRGTGQGSGIGSGSGSGVGTGNGAGTGAGSGLPKPPPPPKPVPVGVTETIKILSKPQPRYTDAARQNQVQGTVTVKVTFNANGSVGSIAPVSGLPYGLTEQAIAAARSIKFEPAKRNGVPYSVAKTIAYTFTIY